jgi:protein required for attachment to host cells
MAATWVLVADKTRARFFVAESPIGTIEEIETLAHPESRLHETDLTSDLPGRAFDSGGQGRHAMGSMVGPKQQEAHVFAKQIGDRLDAARAKGSFARLVIVAPPAFLGLIREHLNGQTSKLVTSEIAKNLARMPPAEIRGHLPERLWTLVD